MQVEFSENLQENKVDPDVFLCHKQNSQTAEQSTYWPQGISYFDRRCNESENPGHFWMLLDAGRPVEAGSEKQPEVE